MESDFLVDEDNLLECVDEYTLYCHYLGFEPELSVNYCSPLREGDDSPSFGIYRSKYAKTSEFLWKDSGARGDSGNIVKLVQRLYGYRSKYEAVARIKSDFKLGSKVPEVTKVVTRRVKQHEGADIRIRPRSFRKEDIRWWDQFHIPESTLKLYRTSPLFCYWVTPSQKAPVFTSGHSYAYRIFDRYQLYFPDNPKGRKFRMDLKEEHILGLEQLTFSSELLIITKSYKDVMCLRSFGYESISPRSENTPLPKEAFSWINERYKRVLVLFDNDGKERSDWYPYPKIYIPHSSGDKDISDFNRDHGDREAATLLAQLVSLP